MSDKKTKTLRAHVEKMAKLFAGHKNVRGTHGEPKRNGLKWEIKTTAKTLREEVTLDRWQAHLDGETPLGVVPIDENSTCCWGSIDYDEYDEDLVAHIRAAERWPLVPCRSKSGGLHLFMFTTEPVPAGDMLSTLRAVAASIGLAGSEIFPKQAQVLTERGDFGNWMVMPYYGDTFGGKLQNQFGLKKTGAEMTLSEFVTVAQNKALTPDKFDELARSTRTGKVASVAGGKKGKGKEMGTAVAGPFGDGPPCLQHMSNSGFPQGGRNNALFMVGLYLKKAFPVEWKQKLEDDNQKFMKPPLTADEVTQVRKQLEKKDYEYTCKVEPMSSHCDASVCRTRKYGVGDGQNYPFIDSISKMNSDPAIWFVSIGENRIELNTADLLNYQRFQLVVAEQHSIVFGNMKQTEWTAILSDAVKNLQPIPAPPETLRTTRFLDLLETFLTNRNRGTRREDVLMGRPYFDEEANLYYFRLKDLMAFIQRTGNKEFLPGQITQWLKSDYDLKLNGGKTYFNFKNTQGANVYYVDASRIGSTPDVDPEKLTEEEV